MFSKPNILFLIVDSFRADKFFGKDRTCKTPNIDNLVKNGAYFQQAISTSDATILNWATIFSGLFPPKTGVRSEQFNKVNDNIETIFDVLQENNYNFYSYLTNISEILGLFPEFQNKDSFEFSEPRLNDGVGNRIIKNIGSGKLKEPWLFIIHSMDLHFPIILPDEYSTSEFGQSTYEKQISSIDSWIGKISDTIDSEKTLFVITADHGSYINSVNIDGKIISTEENYSNETLKRKIGFKIPKFLDPVKKRAFFHTEKKSQENRLKKIENFDLKPHQKRNLLSGKFEINHTLFDDKVRIPLLFYGKNIKSEKIIEQQVRNADIFPTLLDLIELKNSLKLDGVSLKPLMEDKIFGELPAYIESTPLIQIESNDVVGVRTEKYKYFRDSDDSQKRIHLYDLKTDPYEDSNVHENNPKIILEMEQILSSFTKRIDASNDEFSEEETEMIEDELRKMGYV
tara:strand:+ start:13278 stop:14645 length:1368 start_codon:yes stop_codon:yes gene_type:complete